MTYNDYADKVNNILADTYGIGTGTLAYKNTNKEMIALSLILLDILEELKKINLNKKEVTEETTVKEEPKSRSKKS